MYQNIAQGINRIEATANKETKYICHKYMAPYMDVALLIRSSIIYLQTGLRNALRMSSHSSQPSFRHPEQIHGIFHKSWVSAHSSGNMDLEKQAQ
jgi:hypothetical protein